MMGYMISFAVTIKTIFFLSMTIFSLLLEKIFPKRIEINKFLRVVQNYSLVFLTNILMFLFTLLIGFNLISLADKINFGVLKSLNVIGLVNIIISVLFLDLVIYFQHRLFHKVDILWKLHAVHHYDTELDFSSGIRFHPLEILISFFIKVIAILIIGASAESVLVFELVLLISAMFNHSNLFIPQSVDLFFLRWWLVTPDMHIIHHSKQKNEMNSNYGFFLSIWDHLFRTNLWVRDLRLPFTIGLNNIGLESQNLKSMLLFPWKMK